LLILEMAQPSPRRRASPSSSARATA